MFNPFSNSHFLFNSDGTLINNHDNGLIKLYDDDNVVISRLDFVRQKESTLKKILNKISSPRLYLFEFKINKNNFSVSLKKGGETVKQRIRSGENFSINSAFYDPNNKSIGQAIVKGQKYGGQTRSSGFFKVIDGLAYVGPRSLFNKKKGNVEYSCQAHPSVMKDGIIWDYIQNVTRTIAWKRRTFRNLSGINKKGNIIFLVSGVGGLLSVKEISEIALKLNIKTATLFDAGSALQYKFKKNDYQLAFCAYNNNLYLGKFMDKLFEKFIGKKFYNTSPVYINYKY